MCMTTTYSESARGVTISKERALQELRDHGLGDADTISDMLDELGDHDTYAASDVLSFIGY